MSNDKNLIGAVLAMTALLGFLLVFAFLCLGKVAPENKDLFNIALMALAGWVGIGIGYFLGSSDGSAKKTALLSGAPLPGTSVTETLESGGTRKETVTNTPPTGTPITDVQKGNQNEEIPETPDSPSPDS
jgi:hypothetical protein